MNKHCKINCGECLKQNPIRLMCYLIVVSLRKKFGKEVYQEVVKYCPNLTICPECGVDEFFHVEDCPLKKE